MTFGRNEFFSEKIDLFEPITTHRFDQSFGSIDTEITEPSWNSQFEGPPPQSNDSDYEPYQWFTIAWHEHARAHQTVDWDGYTFRDLCYYQDHDDFSIHTFDHWDLH